MKLRTIYYKVEDLAAVCGFWENVFGRTPDKQGGNWAEFNFDNVRLGFLLNDFGDNFAGNRAAVMFEFAPRDFEKYLDRAMQKGAQIMADNLDDPELRSIVLHDPFGNEFEWGFAGTHHE